MTPTEDSEFGDEFGSDRQDTNVDEVLVAYLDGQLAADQSEQIESQLASDPAVRKRLQDLDRVWNALDVLPRSTASPAFTRSTVEMAAVSASQPATPASDTRQRWSLPAGVIVGLIGLAVGAAMTYAIAGEPQRRALRNLPVAMHASALESAGSIEFLTMLSSQAQEELRLMTPDHSGDAAPTWTEVAAMQPAERRGWLAELPADELAEINSSVDRFQDRTPEKQQSLRALADEIATNNRAEELRATAIVYQSIVSRLPQSEQARIRQLPPDERLQLLQKNANRLARSAALVLTTDQRAELRAGIEKLVRSKAFKREAEELSERLPPQLRDPRREQLARSKPQLILYATTRFVARPRRWDGSGGRRGERLSPDLRDRFKDELEWFEANIAAPITGAWSGWVDRLAASLPESTRRLLSEAAAQGEADRARLFERLLREAAPDDLSDAFVDLSESDLEQLLLVPRDRFVEKLSEQEEGDWRFDFPTPGERGFDRRPGPPGFERRDGRGPGRGGPGGRPKDGDPPPRRGPPPRGNR